MIKEIKKIYRIKLVMYNGTNENELMELSGAKSCHKDLVENKLVLEQVQTNLFGLKHNIVVPVGFYLVKDEEKYSIFASDFDSLINRIDCEISIEDGELIKEYLNYLRMKDEEDSNE